MKKRSTFRKNRNPGTRGSNANIAAIAARSFNQNLRHFQTLHDPKRLRSTYEITAMLAAARRRPHGHAARLLENLRAA